MLVHVIADYGPADLAYAEVAQRLKRQLPEAELVYTPVPPFATLAAGFCVAQLGLNDAPDGTWIFHNVAPRHDDADARHDLAGERLAYARLPGGVGVVGVHAGHAFSFVAPLAEELRWVGAPAHGSQFRSRDLFPQAFGAVVRGDAGALGEALPPDAVPPAPDGRVAYVDGFGNMKTTLREADAPAPGTRVLVDVGGRTREAVAAGGGFAVPAGELALSVGSSGWALPGGERVRWLELFLRGGDAHEAFGRPAVGARVRVTSSTVLL